MNVWLCGSSEGDMAGLSLLSPLQEESSLFIMTNIIVTMNQTQGFCPEVGSFLEKGSGLMPPPPIRTRCVWGWPRGACFHSFFFFQLPDNTSVCNSDSDCPAGSANTHSSGMNV